MAYELLNWDAFGRKLLLSEDLDPIYVMLHKAELENDTLNRWLLAYWWFYHAGVASYLAEHKQFFDTAALLTKSQCPRGTERRHFRGQRAADSIYWFKETFHYGYRPVASAIRTGICHPEFSDFQRTLGWPQFGPWMNFKVADMLERIKGVPIDFSKADLHMYKAPKEGVKIVAEKTGMHPDKVVKFLLNFFRIFKAPPNYDRQVGLQEVETILCKWKSHLSGHYPVGKDTKEIREGLHGWGKLADRLLKHLP